MACCQIPVMISHNCVDFIFLNEIAAFINKAIISGDVSKTKDALYTLIF